MFAAVRTGPGGFRRPVALKRLNEEEGVRGESVRRFLAEARILSNLHHPNVVEIYDVIAAERGYVLVMELLEGESLDARLAREPRLPIDVALSFTTDIAGALAAAHAQGIVHRDLKPENLFLVPDPNARAGVRVKVLDFGIAKLTRAGESTVRTKTGTIFGTPRYMAPEQCRDSATVDHRADIYALGCILYEMVLGVRVFPYDTHNELVAAHLHETPRPPRVVDPSIPASVEHVIMRAIAKQPGDRYATMADFAREIDAIARGTPARKRRIWLPIALVLAAGIAITSLAIWRSRDDTATVHLAIDSSPRGAEVYRVADGVRLGKTPIERTYDRTDGEAEFIVKLAGYADMRVSLSTMHDGSTVAHLVPRTEK